MSAPYDIVIFGATGFTGKQAAERLAPLAGQLRIALAGRNGEKLELLRKHLPNSDALGVIVADAKDHTAIDAMVQQARIVVSTAGPFVLYSDAVVESCVKHNVHYLDITGETPWVRTLIDRFHERAAEQGTRIIPLCGVDSVPSDMGAFMLVDHIRNTYNQGTKSIRAFWSVRGGVNGGTVASAFELSKDEATRDAFRDPVLLNPISAQSDEARRLNPDQTHAVYDRDLQAWTAPFVMATINTRVVRRSEALFSAAGYAYGKDFRYHECMPFKGGLGEFKAQMLSTGMRVFESLMAKPAVRPLLKRMAPKAGKGPSKETMDGGFTKVRYIAETEDGRKLHGLWYAKGDPGNRVTILCLCEAALVLALNGDDASLPARGGVLTPATGLGLPYIERLKAAGVRLAVE